MDITDKRKLRKCLVISEALYDSVRLTGKCRLLDCESLILSLRLGGFSNVPDYDGIDWTIQDAYKVIKDSTIKVDNEQELALTILRSLTMPIELDQPKKVRTRICITCKEEKIIGPGEGFSDSDYLCRECRRRVDKARSVERSLDDAIRYRANKKERSNRK